MDEISRLVERLGSRDAADDEQVLALLAIHGRKPVEALLTVAGAADAHRRAAAIAALGRIGDSRARRTLTLALADKSLSVRAAAATALASFPSEETVARLRGMLERETEAEVRLRGTATLVDLFNNGQVEALDPLLGLLHSPQEDRRVRLEALKVLAALPPSEARAIAANLGEDEDARLAQAAAQYCQRSAADQIGGVEEALAELDSPDYFTYRRAASLLASLGEPVVPVLVGALRSRAADPAACSRLACVLKEIARGRERTVARHLDGIEETIPLGLMVDIIGESRDRTALYHLKGVIDRLEAEALARLARTPGDDLLAREMIVAKSHFYLARAGSRVAFDSLKAALSRQGVRLMGEILMAVEEIGGREELIDLIDHYGWEERWMKDRIRETFVRVMKKARVKPDDPIFQRLDPDRRAWLAEILEGAGFPAPQPRQDAPPARPSRRTGGSLPSGVAKT